MADNDYYSELYSHYVNTNGSHWIFVIIICHIQYQICLRGIESATKSLTTPVGILQRHYQIHFVEWFHSHLTSVRQGSTGKYAALIHVINTKLMLSRQRAITWTTDDQFLWRHIMPPAHNELKWNFGRGHPEWIYSSAENKPIWSPKKTYWRNVNNYASI